LSCCFTAALLLFYCFLNCCFTAASLLFCFPAVLLPLYCRFTAALLQQYPARRRAAELSFQNTLSETTQSRGGQKKK
jgi:hypothetical protein